MDAIMEDRDSLYADVFSHLAAVAREPESVPFDQELLKRVERALDASTPRSILWRLLNTGQSLLQDCPQDPRYLTQLLEVVVSLLHFDELKASISADKLEDGLKSPSVPIQLLCVAYLDKAASSPSGASFVAASTSLVQCLLTLWLSTENTQVADRSLGCIEALLVTDHPKGVATMMSTLQLGEAQGHGLLWRRVFRDPAVYSIFFDWTSRSISRRNVQTRKGYQLVTISQARLLDFIARMAPYDWGTITTSALPQVEARYLKGETESLPFSGLLRFVAFYMIDPTDVLMEVLKQDFFRRLLQVVNETNDPRMPPRVMQAIQEAAGDDVNGQDAAGGVHL